MTRKTITLHEIRRATPMGSVNLGNKKLRTKARATKLCKYLAKRYRIETVKHAWKINPTAAEWKTLERMGA